MACDDTIHPLQRGGTNQQQRLLNGMVAGYVNIDEREFADWIVFARAFAEYLKYYDKTNTAAAGANWQGFFDNDVSATLGSVAIQNAQAYQQLVKEHFDILKSDEHAANEVLLRETLAWLFGALLTLSKGMDAYSIKIPGELSLRNDFQNTVTSKLRPALKKLLSYYKGAIGDGLLKEDDDTINKIFGIPFTQADTVVTEGLSALWIDGNLSWSDYYNGIAADKSIYGDAAWDNYRKINHAANHNLLTGLFDQFLMHYSRLIKDSNTFLLQTLTNWDSHTPHYTLFLSFLHLYKYAQSHINTLTKRHLDFYYREVLRLSPKAAEANHAHVVVELAKNIDEYLLTAGTQFKAGKDSAGKEVLYTLDRDTLFNKAKVAQIAAVYKGNTTDSYTPPEGGSLINNNNRLFASPVVNSADGLGKKLTPPNKEWHPFINKTFAEGKLTGIDMPKAQVGFAIASHYLFLTEGQRIVNVKFTTASGSPAFPSSLQIDCFLTTEKEWYAVANPAIINTTTSGSGPASVKTLTFTLPGDAPAIVNYNQEVHGGNFNTDVPILKVYLKNSDGAAYTYASLQNITLSKVEVEVKVGLEQSDATNAAGLKTLQLFNEFGVIDPSKPFFPFGQSPKKGASMIIGNEELFKKKNASFRFLTSWAEMPASYTDIDFELNASDEGALYPSFTLSYLGKGIWKNLQSSLNIFSYNYANVYSPSILQPLSANSNEVAVSYNEPYPIYSVKSNKGFIKLTLNSSFNYEAYQAALIDYNIKKVISPGSAVDPGVAPYVPKLNALILQYKAYSIVNLQSSEADFNNREVRFFHLHPFGEAEQHKALNGNVAQPLLPQFSHAPAAANQHTAELYIGLENLQAGQSVQVLFQVMEGTTNPLLDKPDEHVTWSYLAANVWNVFKKGHVSDNTLQLIQSGIISFVIPANATTDNTLLAPGFVWLRASVNQHAEAVCKFLEVVAQAAKVTFVNNDNAPDFLDGVLPAGTISKLKIPDSAVKKIKQPYNSFGGRKKETDQQYYVRVSERLRHKARAINIWDYEHLILQQFPQIHKVKCISHTRYEGTDYNPSKPGHVTIVTIPDLVNRNDANPLRPYTNQDLLVEIDQYIKERISCHVKLHVRHPNFEEVRISFKVKFFEGLEFNFYHDKLQQEITEFLTPWAFQKASDVEFGGKVHKSVLIDFIEERSYVDFITDVYMYVRRDELSLESGDMDTIEASKAISILVSAPASKHVIIEINEDEIPALQEPCIDKYNQSTANSTNVQ